MIGFLGGERMFVAAVGLLVGLSLLGFGVVYIIDMWILFCFDRLGFGMCAIVSSIWLFEGGVLVWSLVLNICLVSVLVMWLFVVVDS